MKKLILGLLMLMIFAVTVPLSAEAQCRRGRSSRRGAVSRSYNRSYARQTNYNRGYVERNSYNRGYRTAGYSYQRPSFYRRHRNLINVGIASGIGAITGGLIGGNRRGIGYGAAAGAGAGALYTYVIKPKKRRY